MASRFEDQFASVNSDLGHAARLHESSSSNRTRLMEKEIHNVLGYLKAADEMYPFKAGKVPAFVEEKAGPRFTNNDHARAWSHYDALPLTNSKSPENTNNDYCLYHPAHADYTYSQAWVDKLAEDVADAVKIW